MTHNGAWSLEFTILTQMTTRELTSVHVRIHNGTCDDALLVVCFVAATMKRNKMCGRRNKKRGISMSRNGICI